MRVPAHYFQFIREGGNARPFLSLPHVWDDAALGSPEQTASSPVPCPTGEGTVTAPFCSKQAVPTPLRYSITLAPEMCPSSPITRLALPTLARDTGRQGTDSKIYAGRQPGSFKSLGDSAEGEFAQAARVGATSES